MKTIDVYNQFGKDQPKERQGLYHMNCAEVLLRTANAEYGLGLSEEAFKMMQGFGGGLSSGYTCGALVGSLAALSVKYAENRPSDQAKAKKAAQMMTEAFKNHFGSLDCKEIKPKFRDEVRLCDPVKEATFELLQEVIAAVEADGK